MRVRCAASAAWARRISVRKKAGVCPWNRLSAVSARTAATAPEFCVVEGRITEQAGSPLSRKSQGSGKIRLVWNSSLSRAFRSGKWVPVSGSVTPASGCATAFPALSCQTAKWSTSTPPIETMIRSTSSDEAFRLIVV